MSNGPYYVDAKMVAHRCCWGSAIVRPCEPGKGQYGSGVALVCECDEDNAQAICDALNASFHNLEPGAPSLDSSPDAPQPQN